MILSALQDFYHFRPNAEPQFIEYEFLLNYQKNKIEKIMSFKNRNKLADGNGNGMRGSCSFKRMTAFVDLLSTLV